MLVASSPLAGCPNVSIRDAFVLDILGRRSDPSAFFSAGDLASGFFWILVAVSMYFFFHCISFCVCLDYSCDLPFAYPTNCCWVAIIFGYLNIKLQGLQQLFC